MKWTHWIWLGSLGLTFLWGRGTAPKVKQVETVEVQGPSCSVADAPRSRSSVIARWQPDASQVAKPRTPKKFELGETQDLDEVTRQFMAYADKKLAEGSDGQLELLETYDREIVKKHVDLDRMADPSTASRQIYPWLRFVMEHDAQMIEMTELVFSTMASDPQRFADLDPQTLGIFTEGVAALLPGAIPDDELDRFRTYAQAIIETPDLPDSVSAHKGRLERDLDMWSLPLSKDEVIARLGDGPATSREANRLLMRLDSGTASKLDPLALFGPQLEHGDLGAIGYLNVFQLDANTLALLDDKLLFNTTGTVQPYEILSYLSATGRPDPESQRAFFDRAATSPRAQLAEEAQRHRYEDIIY